MDVDARRRRREEARRRTVRQRRIVAGVIAAAIVLALVGAVSAFTGGEPGEESADESPPAAELPRGGRRILPTHRVVAFYGAPQDEQLGALGVGTPERAARRLERQARGYRGGGRPVLPAFELIATVASSSPGDGGSYSTRQSARTIRRYLEAARRHRALLILDIQPGRRPFMEEVRALRRFLEEPDVSLALDPEWSLDPGQVPGQQIGSTDAETVNRVSRYLSGIVRRRNLPQKLLVVHRFTRDMIERDDRLERHPGVALTVNVDGFADQANKTAKYREFTRGRRDRFHGFKLFYREDTNLMSHGQVLRLRPRPDLVVYE
jgi:hypothetical protein